MKYLTYDEYITLGGSLNASDFALHAAEAQAYVDRYTFRRLRKETVIPESVKHCMFALVDVLCEIHKAQSGGVVSSESNDGVSVSYAVLSPEKSDERLNTIVPQTLYLWLSGETDSNGTPLLWRGVKDAL